jgi:hypothetical protein
LTEDFRRWHRLGPYATVERALDSLSNAASWSVKGEIG